jgi:S-adenosylmethionine:tRNA ribosyltransferase-isomerase
LNVSDFDFPLPDDLIAQTAAPRGDSRLLALDRAGGAIRHASVRDLPGMLRAGDLLVANDTRVFPARLLGRRVPTGGAVECLLLRRLDGDGPARPDVSPGPPGAAQVWDALMHPGQKLKPGALVRFEGPAGVLIGEVLARHFFGRRTVRLRSESGADVDGVIDGLGHVPLPPYIRRPDTPADGDRYQTVFASVRGSVAAPTAGLHFDQALLAALDDAGVERATITLHVGYGTFKPVRGGRVEDHVVDPERYVIPEPAAAAINRAVDEGRRIVAVGTTTTRALEDAALKGNGRIAGGAGEATLFIYPGFQFRAVTGLVTNFHLPKSSLLMLVSALAGRQRILDAYREAVAERYRFYSYGDAMVIL